MPEFSQAVQTHFEQEYGLSNYDASALTSSRAMANYFNEVLNVMGKDRAKIAANWLLNTLTAKLHEENKGIIVSPISPTQLASLLKRIVDNTISGKIAKEVFEAMWNGEGDADAIIEKKGLKQVTDSGAIEAIVDEVLAANIAMVAEVKAGKEKAFNGLVGQVMKASKGKANPEQVNEILRKKLAD
jgi:aspartyl-tRNA(Asn)/glutamyl-tRNA(Gln) amidotransferase subunit B